MQLGEGVVCGPCLAPLPFLEAQLPWDPGPAAPAPAPSSPKLLLAPSSKAALLQGQGGDIFHALPFPLSALLRPRQRFIPGPQLMAFGAGRAQGGADGP